MTQRLRLVLSAAVAVLALSGCKKPTYPACKKDKHCKQELGEKCVDATCQNCKSDEECVGKAPDGGDFKCHEFRCQDPASISDGAAAGGSEEGGPCTSRTDCLGGLACNAGTCQPCTDDVECSPTTCRIETGRCDPAGQCETDDQCPIDEICDGGFCIFSGDFGTGGDNPCGVDAVFFAFDSDVLAPGNQEQLTSAAQCMIEQNKQVILEAHADNVGTEEYNILLTERRGGSVRSFLVEQGVPTELLQVLAKGAIESVGNSESERAKDRRVEIIFP